MDLPVWLALAVVVVVAVAILRSGRGAPMAAGDAPSVATATDERERVDLRQELPAGYQILIQGPGVKVVGESRYRDAIERAVGRRPEGHKTIVDAALVAEPTNRYDPNAIAVQLAGQTVGYLAREDAVRYRPVMDWCRAQGFVPCARADVRGGWRKDDGSSADFGITLYVASPEKILDPRPGGR